MRTTTEILMLVVGAVLLWAVLIDLPGKIMAWLGAVGSFIRGVFTPVNLLLLVGVVLVLFVFKKEGGVF